MVCSSLIELDNPSCVCLSASSIQRIGMDSTIMIRVDTLDRFSHEHRAVGYALVAVFMDPMGKQVPVISVCLTDRRIPVEIALKNILRKKSLHGLVS